MRENENFSGFREHGAAEYQLGVSDFADGITLFGMVHKKFRLARNIVMHGNHDRSFNLLYDFHNVFETQVSHRIDWDHHHINVLHDLFLFRRKQMTDIPQVRKTKTAHLINEDGVGGSAPARPSLARNIYDRDIFDAGSNGVPCLSEGDASQNDRVAGDRAGIIVREVIVAHGDGVGLDPGGNIEVGIRHHFGLTPGMD